MSETSVSAGNSVCAVKVYTRVRPISKNEIREEKEIKSKAAAEHGAGEMELGDTFIRTVGSSAAPHTYTFDAVLPQNATQQQIYSTIANDFMEDVVDGYNATIFAYGQTGAGKSYTMFGPPDLSSFDHKDAGLVPRAVYDLFDKLALVRQQKMSVDHEYKVSVSYLQIYQEAVQDLLKPKNINLRVRESPTDGVYVEGLYAAEVENREQTLEWLRMGGTNRTFAHTACNETSSRAHTLFIVTLTQLTSEGSKRQSKLCLADLAGSEKVGKSKVEGEQFVEALAINTSLSVLGHCIHALTSRKRGASHVPYRESKLTFILKDSLGGNSKTALICAVSPHPSQWAETCGTLQFAERAKMIKNSVSVNTILSHSALVATVERLETEIVAADARISELEKELGLPSQSSSRQMSPGSSPMGIGRDLVQDAVEGAGGEGLDPFAALDAPAGSELESALDLVKTVSDQNKVLANEARGAAKLHMEANKLAAAATSQNQLLKERIGELQSHIQNERASAMANLEEDHANEQSRSAHWLEDASVKVAAKSDELDSRAKQSEELQETIKESSSSSDLLRTQLQAQGTQLSTEKAQLEVARTSRQELMAIRNNLIEHRSQLAEQLNKQLMEAGTSSDADHKATEEIEALQKDLEKQKDQFNEDLRRAKKEMSAHSKTKLAAAQANLQTLIGQRDEIDKALQASQAEAELLQKQASEQSGAAAETGERTLKELEQAQELVVDTEARMQSIEQESRSTVSDLADKKAELEKKTADNETLNDDNTKLRDELLRMRKEMSNVLEEKKQMADTLLEKDATSEQIEMLRLETKRLQHSSEKAHQDALQAHKAKDELSATLEALEQNFIRKIQVTSKSNNLSAYFPSPRSKRKQKQHGDLTKNLLDSLDSNPLDLKAGQKKGRSPRSK